MYGLLLHVFENLEQENIRYCLLRDYDALEPIEHVSDIDLLVEESQLRQLRRLLGQLGFVSLPNRGHTPHHFFITYDEDDDRWLKLDITTEVAYGKPIRALGTTLGAGCLAHRRRHGATYIPAPEDELITLLLHCLLDKGEFAPNRRRQLKALCHGVSDPHYLSQLLATCWSPEMNWPRLAELIEAENWAALLAERPVVAARLVSRDRLGTLWREGQGRLLRKLTRWFGPAYSRPPTVALIAPDGAGKSTAVAGIQNTFYFPVRSIYMGLYQNSNTRRPRRVPGPGLVNQLFTQWRRYLTARYHQRRGRLVIFDRYTYDALPVPGRRLPWRQRIRRWLLVHNCPAPDLVLVLDAPGEVLYARKGEHSITALEQQRQRYLALQRQLPQAFIVDATPDVEQVRRRITALIWQSYVSRLNKNPVTTQAMSTQAKSIRRLPRLRRFFTILIC